MTPSTLDTTLSTLDHSAGFDLAVFAARVSAARARPVVLLPVHTRLSSGLACLPWLQGGERDYVLVAATAPAARRVRLAVHAIGHLVLAHRGTPIALAGLRPGGMPDMDWALLRRLLGPVVYVTGRAEETQADAYVAAVVRGGPSTGPATPRPAARAGHPGPGVTP